MPAPLLNDLGLNDAVFDEHAFGLGHGTTGYPEHPLPGFAGGVKVLKTVAQQEKL